jgi:hypothetical protein
VETADLISIPVMIFMQSITFFAHILVLIFEFIIVEIPAVPTLVAFTFLGITTSLAW